MALYYILEGKSANRRGLAALMRTLDAERDRWALWSPVFLGAGIAAYFAMPYEPSVWAWLCVPAVLALAILYRSGPSGITLFLLAALLVGFGFSIAQIRSNYVAAPVLSKPFGPGVVTGRVIRIESFSASTRILLDQVRMRGIPENETPRHVRIRLHTDDNVVPGNRISAFAKVMPPSGPALPGGYDFRRTAWFGQLGGVGFALGEIRILEDRRAQDSADFRIRVASLRQGIADRVRLAVPGANGAVAAALITGDRSAIPVDVIDAMRDSGLAHLLAISGLHMGLVAACLFLGLRAVLALSETATLRFPIKKWAAVFALVGSAGYLVLAGATVPTQRAFLMTGLVLIAVFFDRTAISLRLVAWAAAIILALAPESLLGASFQMSFAAVVALVSFYEQGWRPLKGRFGGGWRSRFFLYLAGVALTTLIAGAVTGLFAMYHFGRITHFGLAANILSVPLTALWIMPWAVVSMLLMPFGLEFLGLGPMGWGIGLVLDIARTVGSWPGAVSFVPTMPVWGLSAIALGGLWLCIWQRRWRLLGIGGIAIGLLSIPMTRAPHILVSDDGGLMGVRPSGGDLVVTNTRRERRVAERWLAAVGQRDMDSGADEGAGGLMTCDPLGCVAQIHGKTVALVDDPRALQEDCTRADIVISAVPVRGRCRSAELVVDRFDLWRKGAHAIWISDDGTPYVETVAGRSGLRPWSPAPVAKNRGSSDQ